MNATTNQQVAHAQCSRCRKPNDHPTRKTCNACRENSRNRYANRNHQAESSRTAAIRPVIVMKRCSHCGTEHSDAIHDTCDVCREHQILIEDNNNTDIVSTEVISETIVQQSPAPRVCTRCLNENLDLDYATCDRCRQRQIRDQSRTENAEEPRVSVRRTRPPAAFISQLHLAMLLDIGRLDIVCSKCHALHWKGELPQKASSVNMFFNTCCRDGDVNIEFVKTPPRDIQRLYEDRGSEGKRFRANIRRYNSAFAFTSTRCEVVDAQMGNMPFKIHGTMYHQQGPLTPSDGAVPRYAQLYLYDPEYASNSRHSQNNGLERTVLHTIALELEQYNPLVTMYRHAFQLLTSAQTTEESNPSLRIAPTLQMQLMSGPDTRVHNLPTTAEVAMIIPNERLTVGTRDIRVYLRNGEGVFPYTTISQNHSLYMPAHYTLLFPKGDKGWHWAMKLSNGIDRLKQRMYYRFRLHVRRPDIEYPIIFMAGRLFQQYIVDIWAVCEQNKLDWIKFNQRKIRADLYGGLEDALLSDDVDRTSRGRLILPSSHLGSARFMAKIFQNSMAIVEFFGKPSLFITFTANPNWIEIQRELFQGQNYTDRPDLVARVFDLKVKELLKDIKTNKIFGSYKGLVRTIEYQKRGLPHLHLLLFLESSLAFNTAEQIDQIISAEIPSKTNNPDLHNIVTSNMVHGPCGALNPRAPCMVTNSNGVSYCSKRFPKSFSEETVVNEDGYPSYKRSSFINDQDIHYKKNPLGTHLPDIEIDNRWIVPYCPFLSKKYNAHINVECCADVSAVKYINKYIYKGSDRTTLRVSDTNDEIEKHYRGRYIGPTEAYARIFEFRMHEEDPTVIVLSLHLPNQQAVYYSENATEEEIREKMRKAKSTLMGYFEYNAAAHEAYIVAVAVALEANPENPAEVTPPPKYFYREFPQRHVWAKKNGRLDQKALRLEEYHTVILFVVRGIIFVCFW